MSRLAGGGFGPAPRASGDLGRDADTSLAARVVELHGRRRRFRLLESAVVKERCDWRGRRRFEQLRVCFEGAPATEVFVKSVPLGAGSSVPRGGLDDEAFVYEVFLPEGPTGPPRYLGRLDDRRARIDGIMLEWVPGSRLKYRRRPGAWRAAARWLASFHGRFSGMVDGSEDHRDDGPRPPSGGRRNDRGKVLPRWNAEALLDRARLALGEATRNSAQAARILESALDRYEDVVGVLADGPPTLLHGEFYCTNIFLVGDPDAPDRVCPFDWETAAVGCGALDVACLARQRLGLEEEILEAYRAALAEAGALPPGGAAALERQLQVARVHEQVEMFWRSVRHRAVDAGKLVGYAREIATSMESVR